MEKAKSTFSLREVLAFLAKMWVIVTAVLGSFLVLGIVLLVVAVKNAGTELPEHAATQKVLRQRGSDKIAVVDLSGEITQSASDNGFGSTGMITADDTVNILEDVKNDSTVKAVVIRINSPGGAVVASDEIYRQVREVRRVKPVVVQMSDLAASGGYYIAAGADKVVANPATITGSIGVIAQFPKLAGLYDKLGIEIRTIKSGKFKDIGSPNRDLTADESAILNTMIGEAYDQFVHAIVDGRGLNEQKVRELADGRIYTGKQAKENGLVDELGGFDTAVEQAEDLAHISNATLIEFSNKSFFESLFESSVAKFSPTASLNKIVPHEEFGVYYLLQ